MKNFVPEGKQRGLMVNGLTGGRQAEARSTWQLIVLSVQLRHRRFVAVEIKVTTNRWYVMCRHSI
jgi:hypothetical protein